MNPNEANGCDCEGGLGFVESASWARVGREVVAGELFESRHEVGDALRDLEETLQAGEEIDARQVKDARIVLNRARRALEHYVATTTEGTEAWGHPLPDIPKGRLWDLTNHPRGEGGEPCEHVDSDGGSDE